MQRRWLHKALAFSEKASVAELKDSALQLKAVLGGGTKLYSCSDARYL